MSVSGQYLNTITENASRLGMRLQESFSERTRDLTIQRSTYLDPDDKSRDIRRQLDSNSDREKLDAMKRLVALISKGRNVSEYFAQVVKNVASQNLEIRKLVYIYLLRYAEQEPDLALLSINTFQKDLTDSNPLIRAMALRVLSGIKVPMIGSLVVLAIKKCAADISPYVRKNAALAISKCYELDSSHQPALIEILTTLLRDRSPLSVGGVAVAFNAICPTRLDLLHQHYRRLCRVLIEADDWGQIEVMNLLLRYARTMLPRLIVKEGHEELDSDLKLLLTSVEPLLHSRNPAVVLGVTQVYFYAAPPSHLQETVNSLLRLLSTSKEVERVVLAYLVIISHTAPNLFTPFYTRFLVRTDDLHQVKQAKIKLLLNVITIDTYPSILRELIDYADDPDDTIVSDAICGIGRCARLIPESTQQCLTALVTMIKAGHDMIISSAVLVLKHLIQNQLAATTTPLHSDTSASQSPLVIIAHLARKIDDIKHAHARACVLWLVGQYAASDEPPKGLNQPEGVAEWAPDVLRKAAKNFAQEAPLVKLQTITLAAKFVVLSPSDRTLGLLSQYVFSLARYDLSYDVRDRARMLSSLLSGVSLAGASPNSWTNGAGTDEPTTTPTRTGVVLRREQVKLVLFEGKSGVGELELGGYHPVDEKVVLGTLSSITHNPPSIAAHPSTHLPDWLEHGVESSLRDTEDPTPALFPAGTFAAPVALSSAQLAKGAAATAASTPIVLTPGGGSSPQPKNGGPSKGAWMDLDKFYEDTEEEEEEEEEESDDDDDDDDDVSGGEDEENAEEDEDGEGKERHDENKHPEESTDEDDDEDGGSSEHTSHGPSGPRSNPP